MLWLKQKDSVRLTTVTNLMWQGTYAKSITAGTTDRVTRQFVKSELLTEFVKQLLTVKSVGASTPLKAFAQLITGLLGTGATLVSKGSQLKSQVSIGTFLDPNTQTQMVAE